MAEALSFGQNRRWRRFLASRIDVPPGATVLDVATGTGGVALEIAGRTGARVIGMDQSPEMLAAGRGRLAREGMDGRVRLVQGQAERLPFRDGAFGALTFTYLLRYVDDPAATLREMARVVRPDGIIASLEFAVPERPGWRAAWLVYTRALLPLGGLVASAQWYRTGRFLGPSISDFSRRYPLPEQARMWREAGIARVRYRTMSLGGGVVVWGERSG
jgi:demethylmenaquinone methyltransferase/2-methoxy-6-polyprenyl-1,4-benzoquinol methylase